MHASICDTLTDLTQNAIEAGASRVEVDIYTAPDRIEVCVRDNGKGMTEETRQRALDPFFSEPGKHDHRRVGLGLPLLCQMAEAAGGGAEIVSAPGAGTTVRFALDATHIDAPPLGDLPRTVMGLLAFESDYELLFSRRAPSGAYALSRRELAEALGGLEEAGNLALARAFLEAQETALMADERRK